MSNVTRENRGGREEREKVVVDIISGLQAVSLHLMGQTSLLSHSLFLSPTLTHSLSFTLLQSAKISSSKQDLIMPIDKMSKYSFSPLEKKTCFLRLGLTAHTLTCTHTYLHTITHTHKYNDRQGSFPESLESFKTCKA